MKSRLFLFLLLIASSTFSPSLFANEGDVVITGRYEITVPNGTRMTETVIDVSGLGFSDKEMKQVFAIRMDDRMVFQVDAENQTVTLTVDFTEGGWTRAEANAHLQYMGNPIRFVD